MASALLGVLLLVLVATYVFVEFFVNPMRLRTNYHFEGQTGLPACLLPPSALGLSGHGSQPGLCLAVLKNHTDVWFVFLPAAPVETQAPAILALAALLILLGLLSTALLGHLLCFHIYLSKRPSAPTPASQDRGSLGCRRYQLGCRAQKPCPFLLAGRGGWFLSMV